MAAVGVVPARKTRKRSDDTLLCSGRAGMQKVFAYPCINLEVTRAFRLTLVGQETHMNCNDFWHVDFTSYLVLSRRPPMYIGGG